MSHSFKTGGEKGAKVDAMKIKLHTVNLEVADPEAAKQFYVDALGMTENLERSHRPDFFYLESVGGHLTLARRDLASSEGPTRTVELGFQVDDLAAFKSHFENSNLNGFKPKSMGWGEVIEGHDPDGHRVILYCWH